MSDGFYKHVGKKLKFYWLVYSLLNPPSDKKFLFKTIKKSFNNVQNLLFTTFLKKTLVYKVYNFW